MTLLTSSSWWVPELLSYETKKLRISCFPNGEVSSARSTLTALTDSGLGGWRVFFDCVGDWSFGCGVSLEVLPALGDCPGDFVFRTGLVGSDGFWRFRPVFGESTSGGGFCAVFGESMAGFGLRTSLGSDGFVIIEELEESLTRDFVGSSNLSSTDVIATGCVSWSSCSLRIEGARFFRGRRNSTKISRSLSLRLMKLRRKWLLSSWADWKLSSRLLKWKSSVRWERSSEASPNRWRWYCKPSCLPGISFFKKKCHFR